MSQLSPGKLCGIQPGSIKGQNNSFYLGKSWLPMGFSRQKYWSVLHVLLQGIFLTQGSNPRLLSLASPALAGGFFTTSTTWEAIKASGVQAGSLAWGN